MTIFVISVPEALVSKAIGHKFDRSRSIGSKDNIEVIGIDVRETADGSNCRNLLAQHLDQVRSFDWIAPRDQHPRPGLPSNRLPRGGLRDPTIERWRRLDSIWKGIAPIQKGRMDPSSAMAQRQGQ